jgi:hypothetical protein
MQIEAAVALKQQQQPGLPNTIISILTFWTGRFLWGWNINNKNVKLKKERPTHNSLKLNLKLSSLTAQLNSN